MRNIGISSAVASKKRCYFLIVILLILFILENLPYFKTGVFVSIIKPTICILVAIFIWFLPRKRAKARLRFKGSLMWWTGFMAVVYIMLMFAGGLVNGIGRSPYDLSPKGMLWNFFAVGSVVVAREATRAYVVNSIGRKNKLLKLALITIFMTIINLSLNAIMGISGYAKVVEYFSNDFLPELSQNILATYLVYMAGAQLSILYIGVVQAFNWFSPILPDLKWITRGLIGGLVPIFSLMIIDYIYKSESKEDVKKEEDKNPIGSIITGVVCIFIIWFAVGVFPIYPKVIATGSMEPMIHPGDVVLVKKTKDGNYNVGDVVQYKMDNIYIFHRIIAIENDKGEKKYRFKGDNNSIADGELVKLEQVKGQVIKVVPKIGLPTLFFKSRNDDIKRKVEF